MKYSDFILEFEVKVDFGSNSEFNFVATVFLISKKEEFTAISVEIETSPRKWAGGIYDGSGRGWLYPLTINPKGQSAFLSTALWNHYRIEAIGNEIRTYVNGIMCANPCRPADC